jgi:hypothetical protein
MEYSYKTCHRLNAHILRPTLFKPAYKDRGKFNRLWRKGGMTISQVVNQLYEKYGKQKI